jgi:hypothetical protein
LLSRPSRKLLPAPVVRIKWYSSLNGDLGGLDGLRGNNKSF